MNRPKGYSITAVKNDNRWRDDPQWAGFDKWNVTLRNPQGKTLSTQFFMGPGHNGKKPEFDDVMETLISDGTAYESSSDLAIFAREFGYDIYDDRAEYKRVLKIFNACKKLAPKVRAFLGDDYDKLVYDE